MNETQKKLLFIYNPNSGKGTIKNHLDEVARIFSEQDYEMILYRTKAAGDAKFQSAVKGRNVELVVCSGGDGTLSEVVSGIMTIEPEHRPRVGFIPTGSTNDTGKSFGLSMDIRPAASAAVTGSPYRTDVGTFNDSFFTYVASFGKLSAVSCFTPQEEKKKFGYAAYVKEGIKALLKMDAYDLRIEYEDKDGNEKVVEGNFYLGMVSNSMSVGGFKGITGGNVDLHDGLFEVAILKRPGSFSRFIRQVRTMILSSDRDASDDMVTKFKTRKIRFIGKEDIQWVIDGENAGQHKVVEVENINRAIEIMTPKSGEKYMREPEEKCGRSKENENG